MKFIKSVIRHWSTICRAIQSIFLAMATSYVFRNYFTVLLLAEKNFSGRNSLIKISLFSVYTIVLTVIYFFALARVKNPLPFFKRFKEKTAPSQRLYRTLFILVIGVVLISFLNNVYSMIHLHNQTFESFKYFVYFSPVGVDFRNGIYQPPKTFLGAGEYYLAYPPFTNVFFTPLQLFNENKAYIIIVFLLFFSNIVSLVLAGLMMKDLLLNRLGLGTSATWLVSLVLVAAFCWFTLSGYPFLFSVERGNYDAIAILFAIASIYLLLKKPEAIWGQVILLSIATHLKLYPAALFIALFIFHRKKVILPAIVVNTLMLFSLGFKNGLKFFSLIIPYTQNPALGTYNHSGFGYSQVLLNNFPNHILNIDLWRIGLTFTPILLWGVTCYLIVKHLKNGTRYGYLLMATIPLMCVVPTVSHDYKLVILSPVLLMLFSLILFKITCQAKLADYLQLLILFGFMFLLGRSYEIFSPAFFLISNKYPVIIGLMLMALFNIVPLKKALQQKDLPASLSIESQEETEGLALTAHS